MWQCEKCGYLTADPDPANVAELPISLDLDGNLKTRQVRCCPECDGELVNLDFELF
jgi:ribosomal protein L37AE/L43A